MNKILTVPFLIRVGLACVFLANSLTAFLMPSEFQDVVANSIVVGFLPVSVATFVMFIGVSDFTVSMLLFSGWRTARVAVYALAWLFGVIVTIGVFTTDALEHLGFVAMAVVLATQKNRS